MQAASCDKNTTRDKQFNVLHQGIQYKRSVCFALIFQATDDKPIKIYRCDCFDLSR